MLIFFIAFFAVFTAIFIFMPFWEKQKTSEKEKDKIIKGTYKVSVKCENCGHIKEYEEVVGYEVSPSALIGDMCEVCGTNKGFEKLN